MTIKEDAYRSSCLDLRAIDAMLLQWSRLFRLPLRDVNTSAGQWRRKLISFIKEELSRLFNGFLTLHRFYAVDAIIAVNGA